MTARSRLSPAASPLEDDDMLFEILLCLPPDPSSLPRASSVCTRWHHLVTDPRFRRSFRLRHRSNPPLLGFFAGSEGLPFLPTLEAPDRVPPERLSLQRDDGDSDCRLLGSRHGLLLILLHKTLQVLVWDPITRDQHRVDVPPGLATTDYDKSLINGALLRAAGDAQHFQVVLEAADGDGIQNRRAVACVYSSETGVWGGFISTPLPYQDNLFPRYSTYLYTEQAVLAGNSLYWLLIGHINGILQFDLEKQRLAVIRVPVGIYRRGTCFKVMRAEGGGLGFLFIPKSESDYTIQLWRRETDSGAVAKWVLGRSIKLGKLLSLISEKEYIMIIGYAEHSNMVLLDMFSGLFMIHLDSLHFKELPTTKALVTSHHAFESVYVAETIIGGEHDGADLLHNT